MIKKLFFQLFIVITCLGTMSCTEDKDGEWEYFHDDLVDVSELPVWMQPGMDDFTKQHPIGVDVYQGEYNGGDIYIIMTIAYNTPYVYDNNGNYIGLTKEIKEKSAKWKRIYSCGEGLFAGLFSDCTLSCFLTVLFSAAFPAGLL